MKRICIIGLTLLLVGCSAAGNFPHTSATNVDLAKKNYRVVKANAIGTSTGFSLLGILPLACPRVAKAKQHLTENAYGDRDGAFALINVTQEKSNTYLILFSLPKITMSADIIEFTDGGSN